MASQEKLPETLTVRYSETVADGSASLLSSSYWVFVAWAVAAIAAHTVFLYAVTQLQPWLWTLGYSGTVVLFGLVLPFVGLISYLHREWPNVRRRHYSDNQNVPLFTPVYDGSVVMSLLSWALLLGQLFVLAIWINREAGSCCTTTVDVRADDSVFTAYVATVVLLLISDLLIVMLLADALFAVHHVVETPVTVTENQLRPPHQRFLRKGARVFRAGHNAAGFARPLLFWVYAYAVVVDLFATVFHTVLFLWAGNLMSNPGGLRQSLWVWALVLVLLAASQLLLFGFAQPLYMTALQRHLHWKARAREYAATVSPLKASQMAVVASVALLLASLFFLPVVVLFPPQSEFVLSLLLIATGLISLVYALNALAHHTHGWLSLIYQECMIQPPDSVAQCYQCTDSDEIKQD